MSLTGLFASFGLGGLAIGAIGWLVYYLLKAKARAAVEEETQQRIDEARKQIEKEYLNRPDNLDDALDRL